MFNMIDETVDEQETICETPSVISGDAVGWNKAVWVVNQTGTWKSVHGENNWGMTQVTLPENAEWLVRGGEKVTLNNSEIKKRLDLISENIISPPRDAPYYRHS